MEDQYAAIIWIYRKVQDMTSQSSEHILLL